MCVAVVVVVVVWWCSRAVVALSHLAPRPSPPAFSFVAGPWGVGRLGCRLSRRPPRPPAPRPPRPAHPSPSSPGHRSLSFLPARRWEAAGSAARGSPLCAGCPRLGVEIVGSLARGSGRSSRASLSVNPPLRPPRPLTPARPMSGSGAVPPRLPPVAVARPRRALGAPRGRRPGMRVLWRRRGGGAPPRVLLSSPSPCRPSSLRAAFVVPCGGRPSGGGVFFHHRGARAEAVVVGG